MTFEPTTTANKHGAVSSSTVQVPTLNVDMSLLRSHQRPSSAAAGGQIHGDIAGGTVAEGGGGGIATMAAPVAGFGLPSGNGGGSGSGSASASGTMVGTTTAGPYNASGSAGIGLTLGGGGGGGGVGHGSRSSGGGMTMMTATATTGGMLLMEGAPVQTVGGDSTGMIGGGVGEDNGGDIPSAGATTATTAGTTAPGGSGGSDDIDGAAQASNSTDTTAAGGVVAIPGPPDVEAALQDVASLMRGVEHTLEDVRMMTVENAILMDSLALVGADV